jgi:cytochrome c biogenesis protein CcmG, thiol:disulfide interchange protein DsbE
VNGENFPSGESSAAKSPLPFWIVLAIGALFIVVWMLFLRPHISLKRATEGAAIGQALPLLDLQPLTGATEPLSLEGIRGKVTLINFWGTWCPPCVVEFPHLVELWDRNRDNPQFLFVSVSSTFDLQENVEEVREKTLQFLKSRSTAMPTYIDATGVSRQMLSSVMGELTMAYPTTILLDRAGIIRGVWRGYQPGYEGEMERLASKLLEEK